MMKKIGAMLLLCATILVASCQKDDEAAIGVSEVKLNKTELSLVINTSETLVATILPDDAEDATVTWASSDATVATVSGAGVVSALKIGETTISATVGEKIAKCKVMVVAQVVAVTGVTLNKTTTAIEKGKTEKLVSTIAPSNATDQVVIWSSDKQTIATVAPDGTVTAVAAGEANITVTTKDGAKTATCKVAVTEETIEWAKYNLVADGANGAKVGTATNNGGLYFQFGSLIGWSETGNPTIVVKPAAFNGNESWTNTGKIWQGMTGQVPFTATGSDDEKAGIGDPCRYYLKGTWRLPIKEEYLKLFENHGYPNGPWKWENSSATNNTLGLTFPASGFRDLSDGHLSDNIGTGYWSASPYDPNYGHYLFFSNSFVHPSNASSRVNGMLVRCVRDIK